MRIVFAGPVPPLRGGIAQHGGRLVEALRAAGHELEVISWSAHYPRLLYRHDQRESGAAPPAGARFDLAWWSPASWRRAGRAARRADLLVFPWVTAFHALPLRVMIAAARPTPAVAVVHNPLPHDPQPFQRALTRSVLRRAHGALVHGRRVARELHALTGLERVESVPMPALIEVAPAPLPPRPPLRLLFLGFVRPYKGLDLALGAVRLLVERGREVELTVAGEFWEPLERWRARLRAEDLERCVELRPGFALPEEIGRLLAAHHLLVAPYRAATQSGVVPLAFAAGRPVVATDVGALAERVREGATGALAPPGDPAAFAAAIERAAARLEPLAAGALADRATWPQVAEALLRAGG